MWLSGRKKDESAPFHLIDSVERSTLKVQAVTDPAAALAELKRQADLRRKQEPIGKRCGQIVQTHLDPLFCFPLPGFFK